MSVRSSLLLLLPLVLTLGGCGDAYYQTRYIPASADAAYTVSERATWTGDRQVYELPAHPPAVDLDRPRQDCLEPDQMFKPQPMLAIDETVHSREVADIQPMAGMADEVARGPKPLPHYRLYAWNDDPGEGAKEHIGIRPVAAYDEGPNPIKASGRDHSDHPAMAAWNDPDGWCGVDR